MCVDIVVNGVLGWVKTPHVQVGVLESLLSGKAQDLFVATTEIALRKSKCLNVSCVKNGRFVATRYTSIALHVDVLWE